MAIDDIKNRLVRDTEVKISTVKSESDRKLLEIRSSLQTEKKKSETDSLKEISKKLEDNKRKHLSFFGREIKIKKEETKRNLIEEVLEDSLSELEKISDEDLKKFVKKALDKLPKNLKGEISVPKGKAKFYEGLAQDGHAFSIKEDDDLEGGFLIIGVDFLYDFTFKNLLRVRKSDLELELSQILFS